MKANTQIRLSTNESFAAFVGLDWADEKHAVVLLDAHSQNKEHTTLEHTPEALSDWVAQLHQRFAGGKIAVMLEQSRGSLLYALLPHAHLVLYPINPQMAAKFRKAFYPSGAKTIHSTRTCCCRSCSSIATGSKPGSPMSRSPVSSNCSWKPAAGLSPTGCA